MEHMLARRSLLTLLCSAAAVPAVVPPAAAEPAAESLAASPEDQRLRSDWPYLARYRDQNRELKASGARVDVVFLGDSITEGWLQKAPAFFSAGRICRGISGQTTPQLLLRFRQDVIDLQPHAVHIMAGTNDIAGNTGPSTLKMIQDNFLGMSEIAIANGVHLILASIPPASDFPWRPGLATVAPIGAMNAWLKDHATHTRATYADYSAVLSDGNGAMRDGLSFDHVHPTEAGYAAMGPVAEAALRRALSARR
jgi:lysophospholipase L1-like esterase